MWKDGKSAFDQQLQLNKAQLVSQERPEHWRNIVSFIKAYMGPIPPLDNPDARFMVVDFGCGTGVLGHILTNYTPAFYFGLDYSEYAIELAKKNWGTGYCRFAVSDVWKNKSVKIPSAPFTLIGLANGLLDITENAEELLDDLLSRDFPAFMLSRVHLTDMDSHNVKYVAYNEVETCDSFINVKDFMALIHHHKYAMEFTTPRDKEQDCWSTDCLLVKKA